ncbi:MAG: IgGFc-binding protein [Paludibacter sp.]|jgi:hypothetical protein|nr:IgGFc-binding protein [Paludibacter sp.]
MKSFFTILSLFLSLNAFAQIDTEFWFAAPDLSKNHTPRPVQIRIMSFSQAATVTVTQPANPSVAPIVRSLAANSYTIVEWALDANNELPQIETSQSTGNDIKNTGILISSTAEVSAYYINRGDNSEAYALKGRNALGTNFIVPGQTEYTGRYVGDARNTVEIVASEDGTVVTIKPSRTCIGHAAGTQFNITLNKGQSYALKGSAVGDLLYNTTIKSNKPVAVNYTDDSVNCPGGDLIGDQIVPVDLLGTEYIVVRNDKGTASDKIYIFPTENGTIVNINGVAQTAINVGGSKIFTMGTVNTTTTPVATYITSNKPISVLLLTYKGNEPGASVLPALSCTGSHQISYYPAASTATVTLVTKTENVNYFTVLGNPYAVTAASFITVPNTNGEYSYFRNEISGSPVIRIENSKGLFQAGFFETGGNTCSYGYFSNYNVFPLNAVFDKTFYFAGDNIVLSLPDSAQFSAILWEGPNGFSAIGSQVTVPNVSILNSGMYVVNATHVDGCTVAPDTFYVTVFDKHLKQEYEICYGNTITLQAQGNAPYQWNTGLNTQNISVSPTTDITYTVKNMYEGENSQMFQIQDSFFVSVKDSLHPEIAGDFVICNGSATLQTADTYDTYLWNTGETTQSITVSAQGNYWVKATSADCRGTGFASVAPAPGIAINIDKNPETCQDEAVLEIPFTEIAGEVGSFSLIFNNANLQDIINQPLDSKIIEVTLNGAKAGIYQAELHVFEKNCGTTAVYPLEITLKYPSDIIAQRWNDVLGIKNENFNGGYKFTGFQWYKNGQAILGATKANFYENGEFSSGVSYNALLTDLSGKQIFTCDFVPEHLTAGTIQTMAASLQAINVGTSGTAVLYDIAGSVYSVQQTVDNKIIAPQKQGIYILKINSRISKIIVR